MKIVSRTSTLKIHPTRVLLPALIGAELFHREHASVYFRSLGLPPKLLTPLLRSGFIVGDLDNWSIDKKVYEQVISALKAKHLLQSKPASSSFVEPPPVSVLSGEFKALQTGKLREYDTALSVPREFLFVSFRNICKKHDPFKVKEQIPRFFKFEESKPVQDFSIRNFERFLQTNGPKRAAVTRTKIKRSSTLSEVWASE